MSTFLLVISPQEPQLSPLRKDMDGFCSMLDSVRPLIFPPHITIVRHFSAESASDVAAGLHDALERCKPFKVRLDTMGYFTKPQILFYHPSDSTQISSLHTLLLDHCRQEGYQFVRKDETFTGLSDLQARYLETYGSPHVLEYFQSHMTMAGPDVNPAKFSALTEKPLPRIDRPFDASDVCILEKSGEKWSIADRVKLGT